MREHEHLSMREHGRRCGQRPGITSLNHHHPHLSSKGTLSRGKPETSEHEQQCISALLLCSSALQSYAVSVHVHSVLTCKMAGCRLPRCRKCEPIVTALVCTLQAVCGLAVNPGCWLQLLPCSHTMLRLSSWHCKHQGQVFSLAGIA